MGNTQIAEAFFLGWAFLKGWSGGAGDDNLIWKKTKTQFLTGALTLSNGLVLKSPAINTKSAFESFTQPTNSFT